MCPTGTVEATAPSQDGERERGAGGMEPVSVALLTGSPPLMHLTRWRLRGGSPGAAQR